MNEIIEVIPAIDIKDGACVRLKQGDFKQKKIYSKDPVEVAQYWEEKGAKRIHVVDLDGAQNGQTVNFTLIKELVQSLSIPVQVGGGIRNLATIERYFNIGVDRIILGTTALENQEIVKKALNLHGADKIVVGVDIRGNKVAVKGWTETAETTVNILLQEMINLGVRNFILTDIKRDGMLSGPNISLFKEFNQRKINLIASGGITTAGDLERLADIGVKSAIVGKVLYEDIINIEEVF